jgi:hypothetical protein
MESEAYPGFDWICIQKQAGSSKLVTTDFNNALPMYGELKSYGDPIRKRADYL